MSLSRRDCLAAAAALAATAPVAVAAPHHRKRPRAIAMWDFSWLERRWDGAGYEDWDRALDALATRGYDAVRIDAFPHLVAAQGSRAWDLVPLWNTQDWGSPDINRVTVLPALLDFIRKCGARGIKVGLSSWFREDSTDARARIAGPRGLAAVWAHTLGVIRNAGLHRHLLYVDLCNEFPLRPFAPFFEAEKVTNDWLATPGAVAFMTEAVAALRESEPELPLFFSFSNERPLDHLKAPLVNFDAFDQHIWMAVPNAGEFYREIDYNYELFDPKGYTALSRKGEAAYRARPQHWRRLLTGAIADMAQVSRTLRRPVITTEGWSVVDYKDWPLLRWGWIKELNQLGVETAAATGQWLAMCTSNFCGPQFVGMWRDIGWHRAMTATIKAAPIDPALQSGRLWDRL